MDYLKRMYLCTLFTNSKLMFNKTLKQLHMNLKTRISGIFLIISFLLFSLSLSAQKQAKIGCIGFYNLENFFDTIQQDNLNGEE